MASRGAGRHLLLTGAAVAVIGALVADVALGEHPTHSVVLGAVGSSWQCFVSGSHVTSWRGFPRWRPRSLCSRSST